MDSYDDKRRDLIAQATAACDATEYDAAGLPLRPWKQLASHLSPLIGESGFAALYRRAVRLVSAEHDWLIAPQASSTSDELLSALRSQLSAAEERHAKAANSALLATFTKLLAGLIGEALTIRLLHAAWTGGADKANARDQS